MPILVPDNLPAMDILREERVFVMNESREYSQRPLRAGSQDIRALEILILNLMPMKQTTEVQLLRLLGNTPLQVHVKLLHMESHVSKNTSAEYLETFYDVFSDIRKRKFDGMIITGAPIEHLAFEDVNYWPELTEIMEWTKTNVTSTMHICWGAQAGLYYHYGVPKRFLPQKMFGVFEHDRADNVNLLRGFDERFYAPHSRHTESCREDIEKVSALSILSASTEAGVYIAEAMNGRQIFVTGHSEYDKLTLHGEYIRDVEKGEPIAPPVNYYPGDDPSREPIVRWRGHSNLLFTNWLNYYVYQETPYDWNR